MAREKISLVPEEKKEELTLRQQIILGQITPEVYRTLDPEKKEIVSNILFEMAAEKVNAYHGVSALEFILFAFMRLTMKHINGLSLNPEDLKIKESLEEIFKMHDITNLEKSMNDWLFDYMSYAQHIASNFLQNRKEHVERKSQTIGEI